MRVQIDRMRLRQVQAQLDVVPHFEGGPLAVRGVHTHTQTAFYDVHAHAYVRGVCPAAAQKCTRRTARRRARRAHDASVHYRWL